MQENPAMLLIKLFLHALVQLNIMLSLMSSFKKGNLAGLGLMQESSPESSNVFSLNGWAARPLYLVN